MGYLRDTVLVGLCIGAIGFVGSGCAGPGGSESAGRDDASAGPRADSLAVLWTSGDPAVAEKVCFMYTHNAKKAGWFDRVVLIVWGPSAKLLSEDERLQEYVERMLADGVEVKACKACADSYGVSDRLAELGIEVKYMGRPLTRMLKADGWEVLTF
ncbi:DsrE family protein [Anaerohalosphaera lusitana]|uniref:DsrE family protein n=1 Tax=Anaerohalosphaera lusitana TaxID=1936003 RepID=UPI00197B15F4|nr:DsrE family protein [Anaerohalosphaera lusitana]